MLSVVKIRMRLNSIYMTEFSDSQHDLVAPNTQNAELQDEALGK